MRAILFASALTVLAGPALAQSCVSGGQFVPCPPGGGMQPGMMAGSGMMGRPMAQPGMAGQPGMMEAQGAGDRRMTRREMQQQRRMMRRQNM